MIPMFDESYYTAFFNWAFEPPRLARPTIEVGAIRINPPGQFPEVLIDNELSPVIGTTAAGWLSTAPGGWCLFTGNLNALSATARACNAAQKLLLEDYSRYEAAMRQYRTRADDIEIAGLRVIILDTRQRIVRLADISDLDVRAAIYSDLNNQRPVFGADLDGAPRINTAPPGYLDAELWWYWARNWTG